MHIWFAKPLPSQSRKALTPKAEIFKTPASGVHLPALLPSQPSKPSSDFLILVAMFVLLSLALFFPTSMKWHEEQTENLTVTGLKVFHPKSSNDIILNYKIKNEGDVPIRMPTLYIRVFDTKNSLVQAYEIKDTDFELPPHEDIKFRTEFKDVDPSAEVIDISIGNKFDFIFR